MNKEVEKMAKEAQNRYAREWRKKNPDKVRETNRKYWVRRVEREISKRKEGGYDE